MTKQDIYEMTIKLYECSITMKEISFESSNILLDMASKSMELLERINLPDDVQSEIEDIKKEILSDG